MLNVNVDLRPIMKAYQAIPEALRREMLDEAVKAGAIVVRDTARPRVPINKRGKGGGGNLRRSLKVRSLKSREPLLAVYQTVFSQRGGDKGYHAHLIESGHMIWRRKKRPRLPAGQTYAATGKKYEMEPTGKKTAGRHILRSSFFSNQNNIIRAIQKKLTVDEMERKILRKIRTRARVVSKRR